MPRGVYDRTKARAPQSAAAAFTFESTVTLDGIDYLIYQAEADELATAIVNELDPGQRASILACVLENRMNRVLAPPPNLEDLAQRLHSFAPLTTMEEPDGKTGTECA